MAFGLDASTFSFLLSLALFLVPLFIWLYASSRSRKKLPPSPPKFPIVGNLFQLGSYPHRSLQSLSKKYGSFMMIHMGNKPVLVASSAEVASEIMKTHDLVFSNRPKITIHDRLLYGCKDVAAAPYGEYWRQARSICVLRLLNNKRVQSYRRVREEETCNMIDTIREACASPSGAVNLSEILVALTNDVICRIALGRKYSGGADGRKGMEFFKDFGELLGTFDIGDYIPWLAWLNGFNGLDAKVEKVVKQIDGFLGEVIEEHRNRKKGDDSIDQTSEETGMDFVDILLQVQREKMEGFDLELDSIKAIILDVFGAGTDTTFTVMEWAMSELLRHPKILKKLQDEVRLVAQQKPEITEEDLNQMHFLKAVIKETLRLYPPIPLLVPRVSTQGARVMGYDLPAGSRVIVNAWAICRDPQTWEDPEQFLPERFLDSPIDFRGFHFELIPFGSGRRGCPGITFAIAVNELALAKLVHKFDFALPEDTKPEDLDMSEALGFTTHRRNPLFVVAIPRSG